MNRGFSTWILSKMVMLIFLFSLVAALTEYYMIYQKQTVDRTGNLFVQSIAEELSDALSYKTTTRTIHMPSMLWVRNINSPYTIYLYYNDSVSFNMGRLAILIAWNDHSSINDINSFAAAAAVSILKPTFGRNTAYTIKKVCLFNMSDSGTYMSYPLDSLLVRPSNSNGARTDYLIVYKDIDKLCIGNKLSGFDLGQSITKLKAVCASDCT